MRINDPEKRLNSEGTASLARSKPVEIRPSSKVGAGADARKSESDVLSVCLSDRATLLSSSAARTEALRTAIREGTFEVDARAIARALVEDVGP